MRKFNVTKEIKYSLNGYTIETLKPGIYYDTQLPEFVLKICERRGYEVKDVKEVNNGKGNSTRTKTAVKTR